MYLTTACLCARQRPAFEFYWLDRYVSDVHWMESLSRGSGLAVDNLYITEFQALTKFYLLEVYIQICWRYLFPVCLFYHFLLQCVIQDYFHCDKQVVPPFGMHHLCCWLFCTPDVGTIHFAMLEIIAVVMDIVVCRLTKFTRTTLLVNWLVRQLIGYCIENLRIFVGTMSISSYVICSVLECAVHEVNNCTVVFFSSSLYFTWLCRIISGIRFLRCTLTVWFLNIDCLNFSPLRLKPIEVSRDASKKLTRKTFRKCL
jgi:hypothetical protein